MATILKPLSALTPKAQKLNSEAEIAAATLMRKVATGTVIASEARQSSHETSAQH